VAAGGAGLDLFDFNLSASVYTIGTSTFSANNAANGSGGAIIVESGGPLTVTTSSFSTNHAANSGGAIFSSGTSVDVRYSRLAGNTVNTATNGLTLFRGSGLFTANDNWWGVNAGPGANNFRGAGGVTITPATWLQLQASASPNTICVGSSSAISADIKKRNTGADLTVELNGLPPFPATFTTTAPAVGNVTGASANFVNGAASATFNGTANGAGGVDVTADSQTVTASVTVESNTTSDPADQAACQGDTVTFSTTAGGPGPFSYSWTLDGSPVGTDSSSVTINTSSLSFGAHTVAVTTTGACGSASQSATLTVNSPTTTTDPSDATVCEGATAVFSTTAGGTGPFSYSWTVDGSPSGGNSPTLNVNTTGFSAGNHTVSVTTTGACGSASQSATLTVQATTTTTDPADQTVCAGASASFSTTAGGTGPFTYAWTVDGNPAGNTPSINVNTTGFSAGNHAVSVTTTGTCGSASQSATLTVQAITTATDPADADVCQGATASFSTTASGDNVHYAWTLDSSPFNGDSSSINVPTGSLSVGSHTVGLTVTGTCGTVSQTANLTVRANTTATDPADATVCQGGTASFSTTASGDDVHYAWTLDGSPFNGDSSSINVPTGSLSVGSHTIGLTVTGTCGTVSQTANLTVQANTSTSDPADQAVCQGATASFSTTAGGTGPFSYSWTVDGSPAGGDSPSLNVPTGSLSVGNHTVAVTTTGTCGSASQSATLTVQATTTTTDPADQSVCEGATANFSTTAGGTGPFSYAWTVDGNPAGGNSPNLSVNTTGFSQGAHTVTVTTTGACGSASQSATLNVNNGPPTITVANSTISVWPPNHQYQNFTLADFGVSASSSCDGDLTNSVKIVSVTSDELDDNPGGADGSTINDIVIAGDCKSVQLRRERDGGADGRVYIVTFMVTDSVGHTSSATAQVIVPLNQSNGGAVNSGVQNTVNGTCP
jgi:hypothetical protein